MSRKTQLTRAIELLNGKRTDKKMVTRLIRDVLNSLPEECQSCEGSGDCNKCGGSGHCNDCNGDGVEHIAI